MSQRANRNAHKFAPAQGEPPGVMRGASYADSGIGYNIDILICAAREAMPRISAQIEFVISIRDFERLRQLARP